MAGSKPAGLRSLVWLDGSLNDWILRVADLFLLVESIIPSNGGGVIKDGVGVDPLSLFGVRGRIRIGDLPRRAGTISVLDESDEDVVIGIDGGSISSNGWEDRRRGDSSTEIYIYIYILIYIDDVLFILIQRF